MSCSRIGTALFALRQRLRCAIIPFPGLAPSQRNPLLAARCISFFRGSADFFSVAGWSRFIRASMLEVLRQDYVRTARAKGLTEKVVINRHALRNALYPVCHSGGLYSTRHLCRRDHHRDHFLLAGDGTPVLSWRWASMTTRWPWPSCSSFAVLTVIATLIRDILYTISSTRGSEYT